MNPRLLRFTALFALVFTLVGIGGPAMAAEQMTSTQALSASSSVAVPSVASLPMVDPDANLEPAEMETQGNINIPLSRWQEGSNSFHGRYDQFLANDPVAASSRTIIQTIGMSAGNGAYSLTKDVMTLALKMEPLNAIGYEADKAAAALGKSLTSNSALLAILMVFIVGGAIFAMVRATGPKPWKKLISAAGIIAVLVIMTLGAGKSGEAPNGDFRPGLASPGWVATKINDSITAIASAPANAMTLDPAGISDSAYKGSSCDTQMTNMAWRYQLKPHTGGSLVQIISAMWETSGLTVWKGTQYGAEDVSATTNHADNVFCHQLDWQSDVHPNTQASALFGSLAGAQAAGFNKDSTAWGSDDNDIRDKSLIAWAACAVGQDGSTSVRPAWAATGLGIGAGDCNAWFHNGQEADLHVFNISGKASAISEKTDDDSIIKFVQTLHGNDVSGGLLLVYAYSISAMLTMLVFGSLALAIAGAKLAGVVMIFALFFVLIASLATGNNGNSKVMQFLKLYVGYSVFAFGSVLVLTIVVMLSRLVSGLGADVFGGLMGVMWTGISPLLACWLLAVIFKKVFKLPSVFKPSSALAWGTAAGAVGGAAGSMIGRGERRAGALAKRGAVVGGRKIGNMALGRVSGGRLGRTGAMAPGGGGGMGGVLGAAAGAAAGTVAADQLGERAKNGKGAKGEPQKFDRKTLRDARMFDNGIDPESSFARLRNAGSLAGNAGRNLGLVAAAKGVGAGSAWAAKKVWRGGNIGAGKVQSAVQASRARRMDLLGPANRNGIRSRGAAAAEPQRTFLASASARARTVAQNGRQYAAMVAENPTLAVGLLAERGVNSMKSAVRGGVDSMKSAALGGVERVADAGKAAWDSDFRKEPLLAASMAAESAGNAIRSGAATAATATAAGMRTAVKKTANGAAFAGASAVDAIKNPAVRASVNTAARVGAGALIGGVLGGPAGVIAGSAVGVARSRKDFSKVTREREAALVNNYAVHLAAKSAKTVKPEAQAAPETAAPQAQPAAATAPRPRPRRDPETNSYRVNGHRVTRPTRPTRA